ncbi:MAG TPA: hypothetical protein VFG46_04725 [Chryseolinea sp.]|nr:hypothetical protein [Chryseolinea sp.]
MSRISHLKSFFTTKLVSPIEGDTVRPWQNYQKIAFRIAFIYIAIMCTPMYWNFYDHIFSLKLSDVTYHDAQSIVAFWPPQFLLIESEEGVFGFLNYINFIVVLIVAILGGILWTALDKKRPSYNTLYYWIRVVARYRLAYGMIGWGLKKIFMMQMVLPTVGMLNTNFADMAEKKLYWGHVGVQLGYEVFLGFGEFIPGVLLLHRKTAALGAALAAVVCFNITLANHFYDAGVAVPSAYFTIIGIFILWYDLPRIWRLLVKEQTIIPINHYPPFSIAWQSYARTGLKLVGNGLFLVLATLLWGYGWYNEHNNYNIPNTPGIAGTQGYYNVTEYRVNGKVIPYNPFDTLRWHDATFERWSSLSYKTNRAAEVDRMIGYSPLRVRGNTTNRELNQTSTQDSNLLSRQKRKRDLGVTRWEVGGMSGDRRYFYYDADTVNHILYLQNKNRAHKNEKQILHYTRPSENRIILSGTNEFNDSIYVVLDKWEKEYPLQVGRRTLVAF